MKEIKNDNFFIVYAWMINELQLSGNELLLFALIFGLFTNKGVGYFGSLKYLGLRLGVSRRTIITLLTKLQEKGHIKKTKMSTIAGLRNCYVVAHKTPDAEKITQTKVTITQLSEGITQSSETNAPNNNTNNKNNINKNNTNTTNNSSNDVEVPYADIVNMYNSIDGLNKCVKLTQKRKKAIKDCWLYFDRNLSTIEQIFKNCKQSDFLLGRNKYNSNWRANIDWLLNIDNAVKVFENNYGNKEGANNGKTGKSAKSTDEIRAELDADGCSSEWVDF